MSSIQERLQAARESATSEPIRLPVPCFADDSLIAVYKPVVDWASVQPFLRTVDPTKELEVAADTLLKACMACEGNFDGEAVQLPHTLGTALAEYLGFGVIVDGQRVTDRQALFLMIPNQVRLMQHYDALLAQSGVASAQAQEAVQGESQAS